MKPFLFSAIQITMLYAAISAEGTPVVPLPGGIKLTVKTKIPVLNHCEVYGGTVSAEINNPEVRAELKDTTAIWNLSYAAYRQNDTGAYEKRTIGQDYGLCVDLNAESKLLHPIWDIYPYRDIKTNRGTNKDSGTAVVSRGSYFKTPGKWKMDFKVTFDVQHKNYPNPNCTFHSEGTDSFTTGILPPQVRIYAVEGLSGAIPNKNHLQTNIVDKIKNNDHYNSFCHVLYKVLWQQNDIAGLFFETIENQMYFDADCGCNKLVLLGYSNGGHEVIKIANKVCKNFAPQPTGSYFGKKSSKRDIPIDLLFTIDPVKQVRLTNGKYGFEKPVNVKRCINFYQQIDDRSLGGVISIFGGPIKKADTNTLFTPNDFEIAQRNNQFDPPIYPQTHVGITRMPQVLETLKKELQSLKP